MLINLLKESLLILGRFQLQEMHHVEIVKIRFQSSIK